jgi:CheY-like chemotaxis protein
MEQQTFISLFKDLISRLYDLAAVETHPLAAFFPAPEDASRPRAEVVQRLILGEIEQLRPEGKDVLVQSPEWRPYLILQKRYIDGLDPHAIAQSLFIGDRQFRRDHSRALQALSLRIWQRYFLPEAQSSGGEAADLFEEQGAFELHAEQLDLDEVIRGVISLIAPRLRMENVHLDLQFSPSPLQVFTDRILLRQILLSLLNYVLHLHGQPGLTLRTEAGKGMSIRILFDADEQWETIRNDERDSLEFARRLGRKLPARLEETYPPQERSGPAELRLVFGVSPSRSVLIVDDQQAAQKMFQRYLSRTDLEVIGVTDPTQGVVMAQKTQPALLILDVMMPHIDGWEVLQTLQLDPGTRHIPVLVCSAWGEPELARSLGAVAFLKKPVIQKELIEVLARLGLIRE